jgi:hypothetical protein
MSETGCSDKQAARARGAWITSGRQVSATRLLVKPCLLQRPRGSSRGRRGCWHLGGVLHPLLVCVCVLRGLPRLHVPAAALLDPRTAENVCGNAAGVDRC